MMQAAGILIYQDGKILGFMRTGKKNPGLGIPFGKVERNETPKQAALRELKEECGVCANLLPDPPFVTTDSLFGMRVWTFRAELIPNQTLVGKPDEGYPVWVTPQEAVSGPYWYYQQRMLKHFGFDIQERQPMTSNPID